MSYSNPIISIIMPTYSRNKSGFLSKAINSVLGQTFKEFEFIIIDDGSIDGSESTIKAISRIDSRIRYIRHDINSGLPALRGNEGILKAKGQYIAFMFDDNEWYPNCLEMLYKGFVENESSQKIDVVVATTKLVFGKNEAYLLGVCPPIGEILKQFNIIPNGTILCCADFFDKYGLYDPHIAVRRLCDWELWVRAFSLGAKFKFISEVASVEYGPTLNDSVGRKFGLDYNLVYQYIFDTTTMIERADLLSKAKINEYDYKSLKRWSGYFRNLQEYERFVKSLGLLENSITDYPLDNNYKTDVTKLKYRVLIVSNGISNGVRKIAEAFQEQGWSVCLITEWQSQLFDFKQIDFVLWVNRKSPFSKTMISQLKIVGVTMAFIAVNDSSLLHQFEIDESELLRDGVFKQIGMYFDFGLDRNDMNKYLNKAIPKIDIDCLAVDELFIVIQKIENELVENSCRRSEQGKVSCFFSNVALYLLDKKMKLAHLEILWRSSGAIIVISKIKASINRKLSHLAKS